MHTQKIDMILALYIACIIIAELMGSKVFSILGINASVAIFVFPITFTINDIVTEVFGKQRALSFVRSGFVTIIFLLAFNLLALALPPADRFLPTNPAYNEIFSKSLRITIASLAAFWLSERLDVYVFSQIRARFKNKGLWLRNNLSNFIGQFFDTTVFMFLAFYKPGNFWFIISLVLPYWLLKCSMSVIETPFAYWGVKWLKTEAK